MNEAERLSYLQAMGVESYIPRVALPGARPSLACEMPAFESSGKQEPALAEANSAKHPLKALQESLVEAKPARATTPSLPASNQTATTNQTAIQMGTQKSMQINVRFHWVIFQPVPEMLLLVPVAHTDQNGMELLKKILAAIDVLNAPLSPLENFVWPPPSHPSQFVTGNSLSDAQETLQALLEGYQLKQKQQQTVLSNVLVFDGNLGKTLFEGMRLPGIQLRILPSLSLMLTSAPEKIAEAKQLTWQRLKDIKRVN